MSIEADADVAARYLKALLARDVPHTDAVNMTTSYMSARAMFAARPENYTPPPRLPRS